MMLSLALALHLATAAPGVDLAPRLAADPGPFQGREFAAASFGAVLGDLAVVAAGYETLMLFANGTIYPSASNFRRTAYALGAAMVFVPPLTAVALGRWARATPASGSFWKALLLATAGQAIALTAGYYGGGQYFWLALPVQLLTVGAGTSVGLHWGHRPHGTVIAPVEDRAAPAPADAAVPGIRAGLLAFPTCPVG